MPAVTRHHQLCSFPAYRKRRLSSLSVDLESPARFQFRPSSSPRRLSSWLGLRLAPSKTHQKSGCHPANRSRRQFAAPPPAGKLFGVDLGQIAQSPQEPKGGRSQLDPNPPAAFGCLAVELSTSRAQFTFQKADAVFDLAVATHKKIDLVFHTQVFKLKRDMQKRSRDPASSSPLRQNPAAEVNDETHAHPPTSVCSRPALARASAAGDQDHSRTPGGKQCK
jgi:hypothetical protein